MTKAVLGVTLAATALTAAAPADAQRYRRYNRGGGDVAAGAVLGGIVGLGIGAAIASSNRNRFYDRRFYGGGYYPRGYAFDRGYVVDRRLARQQRRAYRNGYRDGFGGGYYQPRGYYPAPRGYYGY
ncbi:MAG TPA: hypothetical protein VF592_04040 [Sphingomonas sp.]|uniref:hypothetical protein n=1 Tax=Sphingomonas sp. TaxID=28214 RepID=UPI002EDAEBBD